MSNLLLTDLPVEIFEEIFSYVGYDEAAKLRLVSPQMNDICQKVLNSAFAKLRATLKDRKSCIESQLPKRKSVRMEHPMYTEFVMVGACLSKLNQLAVLLDRYIKSKQVCFFPGTILDEAHRIMRQIGEESMTMFEHYEEWLEWSELCDMAADHFNNVLKSSLEITETDSVESIQMESIEIAWIDPFEMMFFELKTVHSLIVDVVAPGMETLDNSWNAMQPRFDALQPMMNDVIDVLRNIKIKESKINKFDCVKSGLQVLKRAIVMAVDLTFAALLMPRYPW